MDADQWPEIKQPPPPPYAHVTIAAHNGAEPLRAAVCLAFEDAIAERGRLRDEAYQVHGFSGRKFRLFLNNLFNTLRDPRYLEIGLFHGASFCSAVFRNRMKAVGIDNWTEYGGKPDAFHANLKRFAEPEADIQIMERDFRKVEFDKIGKFNVLFYDGSHAEQDQYDGIILPQAALDDTAIVIVDDWNWDRVRRGTFNALKDAKWRIDYSIEVRTSFNGQIPLMAGASSEWHNGCLIAVIAKSTS